MVNDDVLVKVRNLVDHKVIYNNSETNRRVVFEPFQEKRVPAGELRALNYSTGGSVLLHDYLCVQDQDLREEFNIPEDQVEYDWTINDIKRVLTDLSQPIEALEDALEFGPEGIKEMLADYAIKMRIPDSNRRKAISRLTGVSIDKIIELEEEVQAATQKDGNTPVEQIGQGQRRMNAQPQTRTGRRLKN